MKSEGKGMNSNDGEQQDSELDNLSHSTTYAFRLLQNLNELRSNSNNNLCDVEILAGKGELKFDFRTLFPTHVILLIMYISK